MQVRVLPLVILFAGCSAPPSHSSSPKTHVARGAGCARLDPSFLATTGVIVVTGRWHDHEVSILVDTGANSGSIAASATAGLAARPGEVARVAGAAGQWKDSAIYDVQGLSIGSVTLATFMATSATIGNDIGYAFAIGLENLAPYLVDFDIDQGWFCLRDRLPDDDHPELTPMKLAHGRGDHKAISLDVTLAGTSVESMILDTGAGVSTINESLLPRFRHRRLGAKVMSLEGTGVKQEEYFVEVESMCTLGACASRHMLMPGADLSQLVGHKENGLVGVPFFHARRVILDFPRQQIGFEPSGSSLRTANPLASP